MELTFEEIRVLGCLIEKEANTPEHLSPHVECTDGGL